MAKDLAKVSLKKKNKVGGTTLPDFRFYCKAVAVRTLWYWYKDGRTDQWNRIENQWIFFDKGARSIHGWGGVGIVSLKKSQWSSWLSTEKKRK